MKLSFPLLMSLLTAASLAQSQLAASQPPSGVPSPKTTEVLVIQTAKQGVDRQQIMAVMPAEIRATVKLYSRRENPPVVLKGRWRGVIFILDVKTEDEARAIMETLPLRKNT